jgi:hypothetical protein
MRPNPRFHAVSNGGGCGDYLFSGAPRSPSRPRSPAFPIGGTPPVPPPPIAPSLLSLSPLRVPLRAPGSEPGRAQGTARWSRSRTASSGPSGRPAPRATRCRLAEGADAVVSTPVYFISDSPYKTNRGGTKMPSPPMATAGAGAALRAAAAGPAWLRHRALALHRRYRAPPRCETRGLGPSAALSSPQPSARSPQPAARSPQPAARSLQPAARSPQPAARSPQPAGPEGGGRTRCSGWRCPLWSGMPSGRSSAPRSSGRPAASAR